MVGRLGQPEWTWQPQTTVRFSSAPKLSPLKLWLTLPLPTILEVTSATLGVATDEVLLGGMSAADIEECRF